MTIYVTYLTTYHGNLLPPFYIGHTTEDKIGAGYKGSVSSKEYKRIWKNECKVNPHLFVTRIISYHETRENAIEKEIMILRHFKAHKNPMYINKNIGGVSFYGTYKGKTFSEEHKRRISISNMGKTHSKESKNKIKTTLTGRKHSEETILRIKNSCKGRILSEETKAKMRKPKNTQHKLKMLGNKNASKTLFSWKYE